MLQSKRVLVAESNDIVLALATYLLQRQGFMVESSASAEEVEQLLLARTYDAILLDDSMVDILHKSPQIAGRVVLMSADDSGGNGDLPVHATLRKPLEFGQLIDTVKACTDQDA